ncbi:unnamed protein product [Rotaria magnacalcarata]|uniref:Secreted protein n=1 Tax=Rotaria magnacalcarata TaxID=392030 RepID=A0A816S0E3_9BILA|nr:unnamed protein product [Rotaria magnacalcarata]CAF1670738.1 unnamed protein product [Rotaria magnacalcarata]CAF2034224.1 unnamed protein product [Rotaria magnacalcarata]CAF2079009.1 unnamed protein product [Rotaria magnacalcarata]CAF2093652.1 unnamed protein product [Rotaria magnacalcarata]
MFLLILVLLISIPLVSPSYHIPKLGRYHTFLRIGKRYSTEPCIDTSLCALNQQRISTKCLVFFNRHLCWPKLSEERLMKEKDSRQNFLNNHILRDNT